jgi:predicted ATPase
MEKVFRIVLTGGGGSGKSTLVEELRSVGYFAHQEVAREVIKQSLDSGSDALPWMDIYAFSRQVQVGMIRDYQAVSAKGIHFFDRCLVDVKAYLELDNVPIYEELNAAIQQHSYYTKVFITPPWQAIFEQDNERTETYEAAEKAHRQLVHTYQEHGYSLIEVPRLEPKERAAFILEKLNQWGVK